MQIFFILAWIVSIFFIIILILFFLPSLHGAHFDITSKKRLRNILFLADIKPGDRVADLGSGGGRIVIALAKEGAEAHGFEVNPILVWISRKKIKKAGLQKRAFIHYRNFWKEDLSQFKVVTIFQIGYIMSRLKNKLRKELKNNSKIISNEWKFPNWKEDKRKGKVYLYKIKK